MLHRDGRTVWIRDDAVLAHGEDGQIRWHGMLHDVTERKAVEVELERRAAQQAAVALLGEHALEGASTVDLMHEAVAGAARMLGAEIAAVWQYLPDEDSLLLRSGIGWPDSEVGKLRYPAGEGSQAGYTLLSGAPVVVEDWDAERRFDQPNFRGRRTGSGLSVKIEGGSRGPFGVLVVQSMCPQGFAPRDVDFLQSLANVLADALERQAVEDAIRERAVHDPLTGLPNRVLFRRPARARARAARAPGLAGRDPVPRPRPLQARQRQPRASRRRRAAGRRRASAEARIARQRHGSPVRWRRVRDPARGHRLRARRDRHCGADRGDVRAAVRPLRAASTSSRPASGSRSPTRRRARRRVDPRRRRRDVPREGPWPRPLRGVRRGHARSGDRAAADGERPAPRAGARSIAARVPAGRVAQRTSRSSGSRRYCAGTTPTAARFLPRSSSRSPRRTG